MSSPVVVFEPDQTGQRANGHRRDARRGRSRRRPRFAIVSAACAALVCVVGLAAVGSGAWGGWTTQITRSGSASTASINISLTDPSQVWSQALTDTFGPFAPNTTSSRYVAVTNSGTAGSIGSLTVKAEPGQPTGGNGTVSNFQSSISLSIYYCTGTWAAATPSVCTGGSWTSAGVMSTSLGGLATAQPLVGLPLSSNGARVGMRMDYSVSSSAPSALQSTTLPVTWTFTATQRTS